MSAVYDWELDRFVAPEVPEAEADNHMTEPITAETDPEWEPLCPEHPSWMYERRHKMPPVRPPRSACPFCSERQPQPKQPPGQTAFEINPQAALNAAAPQAIQQEWDLRERRRRLWEKSWLERNDEVSELEAILDSQPGLGGAFVPSPVRDGGTFEVRPSAAARKRHRARVQAARARLDLLLSAPLDIPSDVTYPGRGRDIYDVKG